jgi:hypothetical protein
MFKQYDRVRTTKTCPSEGRRPLSRGSGGTIVDIYRKGKEIGYHVEFTYRTGRTKALLMLGKEDIEPLKKKSDSRNETRKVVPIRPAAITSIEGKPLRASADSGFSMDKKTSTKAGAQKKKSPKATKSTARKGKTLP